MKKKNKRILFIIVPLYVLFLFVIGISLGLLFFRDDIIDDDLYNDLDIVEESTQGDIKLPDKTKSNDLLVEIKKTIPEVRADIDNLINKIAFKYDININGNLFKKLEPIVDMSMGTPDSYSQLQGVTCFRGNNYRNSATYGIQTIVDKKLEKVWSYKIGSIDGWTGVGWTGQPAIVRWDEATKKIMNIFSEKKLKADLKEVIYGTLDGNIYFLDLDNGQPTRNPIDLGAPIKGSISVDPRGFPLLYAGQGIDEKAGERIDIGFRIYNLINQKQIYFINGIDPFASRMWGAFDANALIHSRNDTLLLAGENALFYYVKLNTLFDPNEGTISIKPETIKYKYNSVKNLRIGTENSPAIYKNYAYYTDNEGILHCLDLNTLTPVWLRDVTDDSDSTIAIDEPNESEVYLYTACEVDLQEDDGLSYIRKINAFNGNLVWEKAYKCFYDVNTNGGVLASPVIGKNEISSLVIYNIAKVDTNTSGKLIAFDKITGEEIWKINLPYYCWSSPVDIYDEKGKAYLIICDSAGYMYLIEGKTGKIIDKIYLESNIEGSPAVYNNMIVIGTRGQKIWGIKIK